MLSARLGHFLDKPFGPIAKRIPFNPNILTVAGFAIMVAAAFVIPSRPGFGGFLVLLGGICDMCDGILARANGRATSFGAFLDSLLDRYSDAALFLSVAWYLADRGDHTGAFLSIGAMVGSLLVSYARARGESLGIDSHVGLLERPERIVLLILALFSGWLVPVLWVLFILTHVTVLQRAYAVWKAKK
ncbi:MAG: CDP-alcohol phosphatidyltransferase family protein [Nitrospirae bacterium]|nr:CDP-alcohol phosphatidyltransferase family protein [Nitrospirota bacterium]